MPQGVASLRAQSHMYAGFMKGKAAAHRARFALTAYQFRYPRPLRLAGIEAALREQRVDAVQEAIARTRRVVLSNAI
jgi:hypothetical protein